ncbi:Cyclin-U4-1 protein [Spatholobus suberectus]|nr:Cyclin-U4-1 protein [Spatholobus suberectus]
MPKVITFLSSLLEKVAESNDHNQQLQQQQKMSVFHGLTDPTSQFRATLIESSSTPIAAHRASSCLCLPSTVSLRDKPSLPINSFNVHRLLITSVMVAAKFMDDMNYNNAYYAKVGGITKIEMNFLELDFLFGLGFHLNVTPGTFQAYCVHLQREMLLMQPLNFADSTLTLGKSLKVHLCFNEDESSHQKQQQLAV